MYQLYNLFFYIYIIGNTNSKSKQGVQNIKKVQNQIESNWNGLKVSTSPTTDSLVKNYVDNFTLIIW